MIDPELEFASPDLAREHLEVLPGWKADAQAWRDTVGARATLDIPYGDRPRQRYDVFPPDGPHGSTSDTERGPVAMFLHGGYWQSMHRLSFSHMARGPNAHGVTVVVVGYTLCPAVTLSDLVAEIRQAVTAVTRRFQRPVTVYGHSAGGHLAACMLATDWTAVEQRLDPRTVPAAMAISGLFELEALVGTSVNQRLGLDLAEARRLSPRGWPAPAGHTFTGCVGQHESPEFHRQTREHAAHLAAGGCAARVITVPGASHFTVIAPLADPGSVLTRELVALARG